jgi:hypothetical protein
MFASFLLVFIALDEGTTPTHTDVSSHQSALPLHYDPPVYLPGTLEAFFSMMPPDGNTQLVELGEIMTQLPERLFEGNTQPLLPRPTEASTQIESGQQASTEQVHGSSRRSPEIQQGDSKKVIAGSANSKLATADMLIYENELLRAEIDMLREERNSLIVISLVAIGMVAALSIMLARVRSELRHARNFDRLWKKYS